MLKGNIDDFKGLTGFAVGIYGTLLNNDELYVEKIILPSLPPYIEPPLFEEDLYVIFVSGFSFFKKCSSILRELNHFCNVLNSEKYYNKIARMIIICNNTTTVCSCDECTGSKHKWFEFDEDTLALRVANNLKKFFPHIDIDVMPGDLDSSSSTFPQQPMHKALFETYEIPSDAEFEDEEDKIEEVVFCCLDIVVTVVFLDI
jgi:DNA polymerase II small subunit/DNA polymerase delta subunit B